MAGDVAAAVSGHVESEPVLVTGQWGVPVKREEVEGERRLPEPFDLRKAIPEANHDLAELGGVVEVPLQVAAVEDIDRVEDVRDRPALDHLAGPDAPAADRDLSVGVERLVPVPRAFQGIEGEVGSDADPVRTPGVVG